MHPAIVHSAAGYSGHYYAGAVENIGGAIQYPTSLGVTITVPDALPPAADDYFAILSAYDSAGSYDQIGIGAYGGYWFFAESILPKCANPSVNSNYIVNYVGGVTPNTQYDFGMVINYLTGVVYFRVVDANTTTNPPGTGWSYTDGATSFVLGNTYSGCYLVPYLDYTLYEEVYDTWDQQVPDYSFMFYGAMNPNAGFGSITCALAPCPPSGTTVGVNINGGNVWIENQDFILAWGSSYGSGSFLLTTIDAGLGGTVGGHMSFICGGGCTAILQQQLWFIPQPWRISWQGGGSTPGAHVEIPCNYPTGGPYNVVTKILDPTTGLFTIAGFQVQSAFFPPYGGRCAAAAVGSSPSDLAFDSTSDYMYVANLNSNNVTVVDTFDNLQIANLSVGSLPHHLGWDPASDEIFVPNYGSGTISVISGTTVIATLNGTYAPSYAVYNPYNHYEYIIEYSSGSASGVIDYVNTTNSMSSLFSSQNGGSVAAYDPNSNGIYYFTLPSTGTPAMCSVTSTNGLGPCYTMYGSDVVAMATDTVNSHVYAADEARNQVDVFSAPGQSVTVVNVGTSPDALAVDPNTGNVWVSNYASGTVSVIGATSNTVIATLTTGSSPAGVAYDSTDQEVFVARAGTASVRVFAATSPYSTLGTYYVGPQPGALVWDSFNDLTYDVDTGGSTVSTSPNVNPAPSSSYPSWHALGTQSPLGRTDAAMTYINDSTAPEFLLNGGLSSTNTPLGDTWVRKHGTWSQVCSIGGCPGGPSPRWGASLVYGDAWVVMFGGCTTGSPCTSVSNETWEFNYATNSWSRLAISGPSARYDASMTGAPSGSNLAVLFGGRDATGYVYGDTWEIANVYPSGLSWGRPVAPGTPPSPRWGAAFAYDLNDPTTQLILFGGAFSTTTVFATTFAFAGFAAGSLTAGSWSQLNPTHSPSARWGSSMTWFGQGDRAAGTGQYALLFGGYDSSTSSYYADTWYFHGGTWFWLYTPSHPSARYDAALAWSYSDQYAFLAFGEGPGNAICQDGWTWD